MIYGNKFLPKIDNSNKEFELYSVVYNEYCNYKNLLESCTDEYSKSILEAQVQVLSEISFKDIIEKIKEIWEAFKEWFKALWNKLFDKEKRVKDKKKQAEETLKNAKSGSVNEAWFKKKDTNKLEYEDVVGFTITKENTKTNSKDKQVIGIKDIASSQMNAIFDINAHLKMPSPEYVTNLNNEFTQADYDKGKEAGEQLLNNKITVSTNYESKSIKKDSQDAIMVYTNLYQKANSINMDFAKYKKLESDIDRIVKATDVALNNFLRANTEMNDSIRLRAQAIVLFKNCLQSQVNNIATFKNSILSAEEKLYDQINSKLKTGIY